MNKKTVLAIIAITAILTISTTVTASPPPKHFSGGDGSASSPYLISTAADLASLASLINAPATNAAFADKHYRLTADIDLSAYANWVPIGAGLIRAEGRDDRLTFRGVFDGGGKKVVNLKITRADRIADSFQGQGLFGVVDGGTVKNLSLDGVSIAVDAGRAGGVAGAVVAGGVIVDCYVVGNVSGAGSVGGIVGHVDNNSSVINSYMVGDVSGAERVGGVAGYVYNSSITNSYAVGNVREDGGAGGEVVGHVWNSVITDSEVFDPGADAEKMLAVMPETLLGRVVTGAKDGSGIVAVVNNPTSKMTTGKVASGEITAGPNPVDRHSGTVNFFRQGTRIKKGTLTIFNSQGKSIKKISLSDKSTTADSQGWRRVGFWDIKDGRGQLVSAGTYLVKGTVVGADGVKGRISIVLGVR